MVDCLMRIAVISTSPFWYYALWVSFRGGWGISYCMWVCAVIGVSAPYPLCQGILYWCSSVSVRLRSWSWSGCCVHISPKSHCVIILCLGLQEWWDKEREERRLDCYLLLESCGSPGMLSSDAPYRVLLPPPPPRMGAYNLTSVRTSVRPSVRPSVDSDFSEVYGSTGLKL